MVDRAVEMADTGPWESFFEFRLPFSTGRLPTDDAAAVEHFCRHIARHLDSSYYGFHIDAGGRLLVRCKDVRPEAAREGLSASTVFAQLRQEFLSMGLSPPTFAPYPEEQPAPVTVVRSQHGIAARIVGLLGSAFRRPLGQFGASGASISACWEHRMSHARIQFGVLSDWLREQWESGKLLHLLRGFREAMQAAPAINSVGQITVPPGREIRMFINGLEAFVRVGGAAAFANVEISQGERGTIRLTLQGGQMSSGSDWVRHLDGLAMRLQAHGLSISCEAKGPVLGIGSPEPHMVQLDLPPADDSPSPATTGSAQSEPPAE